MTIVEVQCLGRKNGNVNIRVNVVITRFIPDVVLEVNKSLSDTL